MKTLIVIPLFNEQDVILKVITNLKKDISNLDVDFIVVDDCSTDNSKNILIANKIRHLSHSVNLGIGSGFKTGIKWGLKNGYSSFINFDADGQHDSKYIKSVTKYIKDYDFIVASRYLTNDRGFSSREIGSYLLRQVIKIKTKSKLKIADPTSGFVCLCNSDIINMYLQSPSFYPEPSLYPKISKYKIKQVSVVMHQRENGESYFNFSSSILFMYQQIVMIMMGY